MESPGASWESVGWEAAWQQPEEDADRDQVLRLARQLAEARERQNVEALLQVEDLKRALRERAADVARRELEVERRAREIEEFDTRSREGRGLRLRRSERSHGADDGYAEELVSRREKEVQQRLDALIPREREVAKGETALRARELEVEGLGRATQARARELVRAAARNGGRVRRTTGRARGAGTIARSVAPGDLATDGRACGARRDPGGRRAGTGGRTQPACSPLRTRARRRRARATVCRSGEKARGACEGCRRPGAAARCPQTRSFRRRGAIDGGTPAQARPARIAGRRARGGATRARGRAPAHSVRPGESAGRHSKTRARTRRRRAHARA